jgi:hypothetical protein
MYTASFDTNDTDFDTFLHDGPAPTRAWRERHEERLHSALWGRRTRLAVTEELERETLLQILDAESMGRHVPAFLERKLARLRARVERLQEQILSLEDQLGPLS